MAYDQLTALAEDPAAVRRALPPSVENARKDIRAVKKSLLSDVVPLNHPGAADIARELCSHLTDAFGIVLLITEERATDPAQAAAQFEKHCEAYVQCFDRFSIMAGKLVYGAA
ncbi:hypothetical protein ACFVWX_23080 [Streptomyces sp. NPDC058220]|uniref:hypothetical protein n=1 Tax=Streptomyces sp. NPDC058220 TaxID=3346387 RepID=UPI0036E1DCBC